MLFDASVQTLFQAVYDAPDDLAAKAVLADALQERKDPRGEFIALQLQVPRGKRAALRLAKLERHALDFLGPLAKVVSADGQSWEHGFLVECRATLDGSTRAEPAWSTVRGIDLIYDQNSLPTELTGPTMRRLTRLRWADARALKVLANTDRPLTLETLLLARPGTSMTLNESTMALLADGDRLPALKVVGLRFQQLPNARSLRPRAWGVRARICRMPRALRARETWPVCSSAGPAPASAVRQK